MKQNEILLLMSTQLTLPKRPPFLGVTKEIRDEAKAHIPKGSILQTTHNPDHTLSLGYVPAPDVEIDIPTPKGLPIKSGTTAN